MDDDEITALERGVCVVCASFAPEPQSVSESLVLHGMKDAGC